MLMRSTTRRLPFVTLSLAIMLVSGSVRPSFLAAESPESALVAEAEPTTATDQLFDLVLLADTPVARPLEQGKLDFLPDADGGKPGFVVRDQQAGMRIDEPAFVTADSVLAWSWKKEQGKVTIVQVGVKNPTTGQHRYLGYAAGSWDEPASPDPTIEIRVSDQLPSVWTAVERPLWKDIQRQFGWDSAQIVSFFASPWDGQPGQFRDATIRNVAAIDVLAVAKDAELREFSRAGKGQYAPLRLKRPDEQRVETFETSFEECAPTRNSGANEWSAFGADRKPRLQLYGTRSVGPLSSV